MLGSIPFLEYVTSSSTLSYQEVRTRKGYNWSSPLQGNRHYSLVWESRRSHQRRVTLRRRGHLESVAIGNQ